MFKKSSDSKKWLITLGALVLLLILSLFFGSYTAMKRAEDTHAVNLQLLKDSVDKDLRIEALTQEVEALKTEIDALKKQSSEADQNEKIAYLTFDDGPGIYTLEILEILKEKGVCASFFVVGTRVEQYPDRVRQLYDAGNAILPHTYLHVYEEIYKNSDAFKADQQKVRDAIEAVTGEAPQKIFRFPGGATNAIAQKGVMKELTAYYQNEGYLYIDWNVSAEDAVAKQPKDKIMQNVFQNVEGMDHAVILCHDVQADRGTVNALPEMIDLLKEKGYRFKTLNELTDAEIELLKAKRVINYTLQ